MAACVSPMLGLPRVRDSREFACVGVPPKWEAAPEHRENGTLTATIGRILKGALGLGRRTTSGPARF